MNNLIVIPNADYGMTLDQPIKGLFLNQWKFYNDLDLLLKEHFASCTSFHIFHLPEADGLNEGPEAIDSTRLLNAAYQGQLIFHKSQVWKVTPYHTAAVTYLECLQPAGMTTFGQQGSVPDFMGQFRQSAAVPQAAVTEARLAEDDEVALAKELSRLPLEEHEAFYQRIRGVPEVTQPERQRVVPIEVQVLQQAAEARQRELHAQQLAVTNQGYAARSRAARPAEPTAEDHERQRIAQAEAQARQQAAEVRQRESYEQQLAQTRQKSAARLGPARRLERQAARNPFPRFMGNANSAAVTTLAREPENQDDLKAKCRTLAQHMRERTWKVKHLIRKYPTGIRQMIHYLENIGNSPRQDLSEAEVMAGLKLKAQGRPPKKKLRDGTSLSFYDELLKETTQTLADVEEAVRPADAPQTIAYGP